MRTAKVLNNWSISRHLTKIIKFSLLKTTKQKGLWKPLAKSSQLQWYFVVLALIEITCDQLFTVCTCIR